MSSIPPNFPYSIGEYQASVKKEKTAQRISRLAREYLALLPGIYTEIQEAFRGL